MLLSIFDDPLKAMNWLSFISRIIIGSCVFYLSVSLLKEKVFMVTYLVSVLFGVHLLLVSSFFWSEMIFMALVFISVCMAIDMKNNPANFYWMMIAGFLFCLQRNAGLFIVSGMCVWLFITVKTSWTKRILKAAIFFMVCTSGLWVWNFYNALTVAGEPAFYEHSFGLHVGTNLFIVLSAFGKLMTPFSSGGETVAGAVVLLGISFLLSSDYRLRGNGDWILLLLLFVFYVAGFLLLSPLDTHEIDRYFSVIIPVFLLLFFRSVEIFIGCVRWRYFITVCLLLWMIYPLVRTAKNAIRWHERSCLVVSAK